MFYSAPFGACLMAQKHLNCKAWHETLQGHTGFPPHLHHLQDASGKSVVEDLFGVGTSLKLKCEETDEEMQVCAVNAWES